MRKLGVLVLICMFLVGCDGTSTEIERGMALRSRILQSSKCSFDAEITADYGDKVHIFSVSCEADQKGDIRFRVSEPESIAGITGTINGDGGHLTFDDTALHFDLLADEQLSPVSAPWILMKTLRSGHLTSACTEDGRIRLTIDDSYDEDALNLDIWLDQQDLPERGEILYDGRRILSLAVKNFAIM